MMPYIIGRDPETNEILVGNRRDSDTFLRGSADSEAQIRDLVEAANRWIDQPQDQGTRLEQIARIIEVGVQRLLMCDGPAGGQPPDISLAEWRRMYQLAIGHDTPPLTQPKESRR